MFCAHTVFLRYHARACLVSRVVNLNDNADEVGKCVDKQMAWAAEEVASNRLRSKGFVQGRFIILVEACQNALGLRPGKFSRPSSEEFVQGARAATAVVSAVIDAHKGLVSTQC